VNCDFLTQWTKVILNSNSYFDCNGDPVERMPFQKLLVHDCDGIVICCVAVVAFASGDDCVEAGDFVCGCAGGGADVGEDDVAAKQCRVEGGDAAPHYCSGPRPRGRGRSSSRSRSVH
jgi:hypothetical protein